MFLEEVIEELALKYNLNKDKIKYDILFNNFGDISLKIAFLFKNPVDMAKKIAGEIKHEYIKKIEVKGPYINIFLSDSFYENELKKKRKIIKNKKLVLLEYPSVNPNKPWHIGHLRNALIGDSLSKIYSFLGYNVIRMDYIDDLGLQVAQSLYGYEKLGKKPNKKFDHFIGEEYVEIANKLDKIKNEIDEILKKMEEGNNEIAKKARWLAEEVVKAQYETAFNFNIKHDVLVFESDIIRELYDLGISFLKNNKTIYFSKEGKTKGCWVVDIEDKTLKNPQKILIRSNGIATYTGKDLIFHLWKIGAIKKPLLFEPFLGALKSSSKGKPLQYDANIIINIIGMEQSLPQSIIEKIIKKLGYKVEFYHVSYEHATLPGKKLSGRKGTWLGFSADDIYDEAYKRALEKSKNNKIARAVALAAIKFYFLKTSNMKKVIFDYNKALSLEGDSGPYLLYSYVRANSILKKASIKKGKVKYFNIDEKLLIKQFLLFESAIKRAKKENDPHYIADYALALSSQFNKFYAKNPVLKDKENMYKRVLIVKKFAEILKNSLFLLGIETIEKM